jgi:hypothetical protein
MATAKQEQHDSYPLHPNKPITTQQVVGQQTDVGDGLMKIAGHVIDHAIREGRYEFFQDGVIVRVTLSDKRIVRSWPDA